MSYEEEVRRLLANTPPSRTVAELRAAAKAMLARQAAREAEEDDHVA